MIRCRHMAMPAAHTPMAAEGSNVKTDPRQMNQIAFMNEVSWDVSICFDVAQYLDPVFFIRSHH